MNGSKTLPVLPEKNLQKSLLHILEEKEDVHMLNIECFTYLHRALESTLNKQTEVS